MSNQITHVSRTARHVSHRGQPSRLSLRAFRPRGCSRARRPQRQAKRMPHLPGRPGRAHCFALLSHGCFFTLNLNPTPSQKCDEHSIFAPPNRHTLLVTLTFLALTHVARMVHRCSLVRDGLVATISEMPLVDREAWSFFPHCQRGSWSIAVEFASGSQAFQPRASARKNSARDSLGRLRQLRNVPLVSSRSIPFVASFVPPHDDAARHA
jgi:hypothetical protein